MLVKCPVCEEKYHADRHDMGNRVKCPCGAEFTIGDTGVHCRWSRNGIIAMSLLGVGILSFILGAAVHKLFAVGIIFFWVGLAMSFSDNKFLLTCDHCGYSGSPERSGGPSLILFLLLLLFGIIPGIVYLLVVHEKRSCPNCGAVAKKTKF